MWLTARHLRLALGLLGAMVAGGSGLCAQGADPTCLPERAAAEEIYAEFLRTLPPFGRDPSREAEQRAYRKAVARAVEHPRIESRCRVDIARRVLVDRRDELSELMGGTIVHDPSLSWRFADAAWRAEEERHLVNLLLDELRQTRAISTW